MAHITRTDPQAAELNRIRREARVKGRGLDPRAKAEEAWTKLTKGAPIQSVTRPGRF